VPSLNHPHISTLFDVGREGDTDYLVMELMEGETLAARLERGPLPTDLLLRTGIEIADALDRAHRSGIVHRDLKPGNVMLTKGGAKLMDFGLARGAGPTAGPSGSALSQTPTMSQPLTVEGTILGTFQYMAPSMFCFLRLPRPPRSTRSAPRSTRWRPRGRRSRARARRA
jgi:serine/threonine protein kinase